MQIKEEMKNVVVSRKRQDKGIMNPIYLLLKTATFVERNFVGIR